MPHLSGIVLRGGGVLMQLYCNITSDPPNSYGHRRKKLSESLHSHYQYVIYLIIDRIWRVKVRGSYLTIFPIAVRTKHEITETPETVICAQIPLLARNVQDNEVTR